MAQTVVFMFLVTLTLSIDLCSIFLSSRMYWNLHAKFHKNGLFYVLFLVKRELVIFKNVNCEWNNSGDW